MPLCPCVTFKHLKFHIIQPLFNIYVSFIIIMIIDSSLSKCGDFQQGNDNIDLHTVEMLSCTSSARLVLPRLHLEKVRQEQWTACSIINSPNVI